MYARHHTTEWPCGGEGSHRIDIDFHSVHLGVAHFVVGGIDQDLVKDLVKAWDIFNVLEHQLLAIVHPQLLLLPLSAAYRWHRVSLSALDVHDAMVARDSF